MRAQDGKENLRRVNKFYGLDQYGFSEIPCKTSGKWLTKLIRGKEYPCDLCFRAGLISDDARKHLDRRNWKKYRKHQYK